MPCAGLLPLQWAANTMRAWLGTGHAMDCVKGLRPLGACPERSPVIAPGEQAANLREAWVSGDTGCHLAKHVLGDSVDCFEI